MEGAGARGRCGGPTAPDTPAPRGSCGTLRCRRSRGFAACSGSGSATRRAVPGTTRCCGVSAGCRSACRSATPDRGEVPFLIGARRDDLGLPAAWHPGGADLRVEVHVVRAMQHVRLQIEPVPTLPVGPSSAALATQIGDTIKARWNFQAEVVIVPTGSLPRFEMKARRFFRITEG